MSATMKAKDPADELGTSDFSKIKDVFSKIPTVDIVPRNLKHGDKGADVSRLQETLNLFGAKLKVDGIFGNLTQGAVINFQDAHALKTDGIVGNQTRAMLNSSQFEVDPNISIFFGKVMDALKKGGGYWNDDLVRTVGSLIGGNCIQLPEFIDKVLVPGTDYMTISVILKQCLQDIHMLSGDADTIYRFQKRLEALSEFITYVISLYNPWAYNPLSESRIKVVLTALSQIGRVSAKTPSPTVAKERYGWQLLDEYYATAYGCRCMTSTCQDATNNDGTTCQYTTTLRNQVRYMGSTFQAWCGLFCQWAYRTSLGNASGLKDWSYKPVFRDAKGRGMVQITDRTAVKPGDMACIEQPHQHHCIVVKVEGNEVITVDGNTVNKDATPGAVKCYSGVWLRRRDQSKPKDQGEKIDTFYKVTAFNP